jgi:protein gp37
MSTSNIEWTEQTWNPVAGCSLVSPGCTNCYAMRMAARLVTMGQAKYAGTTHKVNGHHVWTGKINLDPEALMIPLKRKKPTTWFVNSMSDLFHEEVDSDFIDQVFAVMAMTPRHTYQILTKRPERMAEYLDTSGLNPEEDYPDADYRSRPGHKQETIRDIALTMCSELNPVPSLFEWPLPNIWLGTSVENQKYADERIPHLLRCPAAVRFLSVEPLLGAVDLSVGHVLKREPECDLCEGPTIDWVIVGGESGPGARPMNIEWARSIVRQCQVAGVACFVKQLGAVPIQRCGNCGHDVGKVRGGYVDVCGPGHAQLLGEVKAIQDSKGGDMDQWPLDLRIRQFPARPSADATGEAR